MSFETLRTAAATSNNDGNDNRYDGPDIPAHLDEPPPLQPGDADYTHSVLFDPNRLPIDAQRDELLERIRDQFPDLKWCLDPVSVKTLNGRMHIYSAYHTRIFQENGYVAEIEPPRFWPPKRSVRCKQAWDAFFVHAEILDAIIRSCCTLPAARRRNLVFHDGFLNVLTPICGLIADGDQTRGTNVLCEVEGLLVAPRTFDRPRIAYPADPFVFNTASKNAQAEMESFYAPTRLAIRRRTDKEVAAWSNFIGDRFNIDGLILSYAQVLALLRVQATEWSYREERGYVASGTAIFQDERNAQATKSIHSVEYLHGHQINLRLAGNRIAPDVRRPTANLADDVTSILAGGIGLENEAIWRDDQVLRESFSPQLLELVAAWISELKRMQRATLTEFVARLIQEIVTGELDYLDELADDDDLSALQLVRSQLPEAIWREMLDIAINAPDHINAIEVHYRWNENPTDPIAIERDGDSIVIVGPLIDLRAHNHPVWAQRAELFRERGNLTI